MTAALRSVLRHVTGSRIALVGVLAAACAAGLAFSLGGSSDHTLVARFRDVNGLVSGNEVRIAGIEAGTVKDIVIRHDAAHAPCATPNAPEGSCDPTAQPHDSDEYAEVTMTIRADRWPLHQGTVVAVRPKGTLSNVDVTITPGPQGKPALADGAMFDFNFLAVPGADRQRTSWPVNLDALNDVFGSYALDPQVQITDAIKTQIAEGQKALGGLGAANLNGTLVNLNPLTSQLTPLTQVLADRSPELHRLNGEYATVFSEIASEDASLRGILANGTVVFSVIVAKQQDLQGTLDHAASTFKTLNAVLDGEETNLITILDKGPALLDKAKQSSDLIFPLIDAVNPHIPQLQTLLHEFITATGYTATDLTTGKPIETLRVDGSMGTKTTYGCGGYPYQQVGCATNPASATVPTGQGSATTAAAPAAPLAGGLFG